MNDQQHLTALFVSLQLEFTPEQLEGKVVTTVVLCVAWTVSYL